MLDKSNEEFKTLKVVDATRPKTDNKITFNMATFNIILFTSFLTYFVIQCNKLLYAFTQIIQIK